MITTTDAIIITIAIIIIAIITITITIIMNITSSFEYAHIHTHTPPMGWKQTVHSAGKSESEIASPQVTIVYYTYSI
jgi:hypothetical protein